MPWLEGTVASENGGSGIRLFTGNTAQRAVDRHFSLYRKPRDSRHPGHCAHRLWGHNQYTASTEFEAVLIHSVPAKACYLARSSDPPPGNKVIWRGMVRLADIEFGFLLRAHPMGN